jgi:hypothetical protein
MNDLALMLRQWMDACNPQVLRSLSIRFLADVAKCKPTDPALALAIDVLETEGRLRRCMIYDDGTDEGVIFDSFDLNEAFEEGCFVHPHSGKEIPLDDPNLHPYWCSNDA